MCATPNLSRFEIRSLEVESAKTLRAGLGLRSVLSGNTHCPLRAWLFTGDLRLLFFQKNFAVDRACAS
jgi:hypothetical protein